MLTLVFLPLKAVGTSQDLELDHMQPDLSNRSSLQTGAGIYMNYCMGCHSLQFSRYERVADDLGIPHDLMLANLMFDPDQKIGALMENNLDEVQAKRWFGVAPPDLTLVARARGADWLYTYLRTFYADPARPYGVNNRVFPDVAMPHALLSLQGLQECAPDTLAEARDGIRRDPLTGMDIHVDRCAELRLAETGELSAEEFDSAMYDLVNFLAYVGEPAALHRERIGMYVLLFIALFFVFTWLLDREYWKDIH